MAPNQFDQPNHHYALLDCAAHDHAYTELTEQFPDVARRSIFDDTPEEGLVSASPILITFDPGASDKRLRDWLLQLERSAPSVTWITSPFGLATLAAMLSSRYPCRIEDSTDAVLRFWDPRILLGLPFALDDEQKKHFFFPVLDWTVWEARCQQYYTITPPPGAMPVPRFRVEPMTLTNAQRETLMYYDRETLYEAIIEDWTRHCFDAVAHISPGMQREIAIAAASRAAEHGIHQASEQILFARLMMTVSPSFDDHPAIRQKLVDPDVPLGDRLGHALASLPAQIWLEASEGKRYDALFEKTLTTATQQA